MSLRHRKIHAITVDELKAFKPVHGINHFRNFSTSDDPDNVIELNVIAVPEIAYEIIGNGHIFTVRSVDKAVELYNNALEMVYDYELEKT